MIYGQTDFSQIYTLKTYYNPGFVNTERYREIRFFAREQMPFVSGGYKTSGFGYSDYFPRYNGGIDFFVLGYSNPTDVIRSVDMSISYSYDLRLARDFFSALAMSFSYFNLSYNFRNITTFSMLDPVNGAIYPLNESIEPLAVNDLSIGFSFLFYGKHFFLGGYVRNLVRKSLTQQVEQKGDYILLAGLSKQIGGYKGESALEFYLMNRNFYYFQSGLVYLLDDLWFGVSLNNVFFPVQITKINFDMGKKYKKFWLSFSYGFYTMKKFSSVYELSIILRLKNKNGGRNTIICPAYQL